MPQCALRATGEQTKRYHQLKAEYEKLQAERNILREQKNGFEDQCLQLRIKIGN